MKLLSLSRNFTETHGWGHGFLHGERQGTCAGVIEDQASTVFESIEDEVIVANKKGIMNWEIRQAGDKGFGIFALRDFPAEEVLFRATSLRETTERTSHSVQTDWNRHVSGWYSLQEMRNSSVNIMLINCV